MKQVSIVNYQSMIPELGSPRFYDGMAKFSTHDHLCKELKKLGCEVAEMDGVLLVSSEEKFFFR
jgi:hypothetical protein